MHNVRSIDAPKVSAKWSNAERPETKRTASGIKWG
jgi:hypothetical protein